MLFLKKMDEQVLRLLLQEIKFTNDKDLYGANDQYCDERKEARLRAMRDSGTSRQRLIGRIYVV